MTPLRKILDLFLYSNIFISVCAAAMTAETYFLIEADLNWYYIVFVFASTLALYNFPVLIPENFLPEQSGRHKWVSENKKMLAAIFVLATAATGMLVFFFSLKFILCFVPVALLAFAYFFPQTQLRGVAALKTLVVAGVWTCVTVFFPLLINSGFDRPQFFTDINGTLLLQNFLFIFPLCLIFNVRDIEADRKAGVHTLPVIYGIRVTQAICSLFLVLFIVFLFSSQVLTQVRVPLLLSAIPTSALIYFSSEKRSDYYYTLWVDGMILLQALFVFALHPQT